MEKKEYINRILKFAEKFAFEKVSQNSEGEGLSIFTDYPSGISLRIIFNEDDEMEFYFFQKTSSWIYSGERTDLHDIISVVFAAFLKMFNKQISCAFFDVPNPAVPELSDSEIYARYIVPLQFKPQFKEINEKGIEEFQSLMTSIVSWKYLFWSVVGCPCEECARKFNPPFDHKFEISDDLKLGISETLKETKNWNQSTRYLPTWEYYKDFDRGISVIKSEGLSSLMNSLNKKIKGSTFNYLNGIDGDLVFNDYLHNFISNNAKRQTKAVLKSISDSGWENPFFIPLENIVLASGNEHLVFIESIGDKYEFKKERDKIKKRHENESKILFPVYQFQWNTKIDPELFESLVKDLLGREPNVNRVRRVAPLNQPDGGRDLIMEWNHPVTFNDEKGNSPFITKKIIVQCKAYNKSVGKSDVQDIRDSIDRYDYDGYFLAVSSQITTSLTDYLDKLRNKGLWIDWWNRDEIEERLSVHKDIVKKYDSIVNAIHE